MVTLAAYFVEDRDDAFLLHAFGRYVFGGEIVDSHVDARSSRRARGARGVERGRDSANLGGSRTVRRGRGRGERRKAHLGERLRLFIVRCQNCSFKRGTCLGAYGVDGGKAHAAAFIELNFA